MRFVVAHELGHTFFYADGAPPRRVNAPDRSEENFCHRFASTLLVPRAAAFEAGVDPQGLFALSHRYDVSPRVAARAMALARPELTLLWLRIAPHPQRGGGETMRVQWGVSSRYMAHGESFKSGLAGLAPGTCGQTTERLRLSGQSEMSSVTAWRFKNSMLAVVRRASEPGADCPVQATLF